MLKKLGFVTKSISKKMSRYESFLQSNNALYIEQMYNNWVKDPRSVHASWDAYFKNVSTGIDPKEAFVHPEQLKDQKPVSLENKKVSDTANILADAIKQFRKFGHYMAEVDPLNHNGYRPHFDELTDFYDIENWGIPQDQYDEPMHLPANLRGDFMHEKEQWTPREIHERLKEIYCGKISFEYMHMPRHDECDWFRERIEKKQKLNYTKEQKLDLLERILESQAFSLYCEKKFSTAKRFGCEGLDSTISALGKLKKSAHKHKVKEIVIGMAHRGRLNTLACVLKKPYEHLFAEFEHVAPKNSNTTDVHDFTGDVKYHLGASNIFEYKDGSQMKINLLPNPSHLEAVNPVVMGSVKARQDETIDIPDTKILPVIIHGDAAIAGQGINYEIQQFEKIENFEVDGSLHIVFNNQVGFTTDPKYARSGFYATNLAHMNKNPVIHVNADDPEMVDWAIELAVEFRDTFSRDVFVDIVGYRRAGHNEQDMPKFTQPEMYNLIDKQVPMYLQYKEKLIKEGIITEDEFNKKLDAYMKKLEEHHMIAKSGDFKIHDLDSFTFNKLVSENDNTTYVDKTTFRDVAKKIFTLDEKYKAHKVIKKLYDERLRSVEQGDNIDWATAELMAYGTLLAEGYNVRLTGEDVMRGTFSHRHAMIADQETGEFYAPMKQVLTEENKHLFTIANSVLSEYGVLGYEYGYSLASPQGLTIWEGQFGDFANGAQIIIDQFITSGEKKWGKFTGLTMLLPHGYDGQGPEHSNARLERYLMNVSDDYIYLSNNKEARNGISVKANMSVCNVTNAANFFHLLRSQVKKNYRKPLIVMSPKKLLRAKGVKSNIEEFLEPNIFETVLDDPVQKKGSVRKIIVCSGQIYFDLVDKRKELGLDNDIAIIRLERIGPFPYNKFEDIISNYNKDTPVVFVQEEHLNFGAWFYVQPRMNLILKEQGFKEASVVARHIAASSATGLMHSHIRQHQNLLKDAFE